jgi:Mn2+/Fe2+ NRAMP family transporter
MALVIVTIVMLFLSLRSTERGGRYRPDRWRPLDTWIAGLSLGTGAVYLLSALLMPKLLSYYPYPQASWPGLDWPLAMILALMGMPVVSALHD